MHLFISIIVRICIYHVDFGIDFICGDEMPSIKNTNNMWHTNMNCRLKF